MGLVDKALGSIGLQRKMSSLDLFKELFGSRESQSGHVVNWQNAIEVATVLACVRVIANGIAQIPFQVYQDDGGGKRVARDHPLHPIIHRRPNPWQTSYSLRETFSYHTVLTGNAFVWKGMVGSNREVRSLEPIEPGRVTVEKDAEGTINYRVRADDGAHADFSADEIWHIRGPSWNAWMGMDATKMARDAIGLSMATESAHAEMHKGSARVSGLLAMKESVSAEKFQFLANWLDKHSDGGDRAGKPLILDNGAQFTPFGMSGVDAQHLETRKHQIEEICRAFGVMPIMVGHADKTATYASAEQMFLAHVVHTLSPWYERIEQSADANLLSEADRAAGYYTKFTPNALMRGAAADRASFYSTALGSGGHGTAWMTTNEVRQLEELDAIDGGDELPAPPEASPPPPSEPSEGDDGTD